MNLNWLRSKGNKENQSPLETISELVNNSFPAHKFDSLEITLAIPLAIRWLAQSVFLRAFSRGAGHDFTEKHPKTCIIAVIYAFISVTDCNDFYAAVIRLRKNWNPIEEVNCIRRLVFTDNQSSHLINQVAILVEDLVTEILRGKASSSVPIYCR